MKKGYDVDLENHFGADKSQDLLNLIAEALDAGKDGLAIWGAFGDEKFAELVGAELIVEKVEIQADLELARQVGAQLAQGWQFGQPVDLRPEATK